MSRAATATLNKFCQDSRVAGEDVADISTSTYQSIEEVDHDAWKSAIGPSRKFMSVDYLRALETANDEGLELRYAVFMREGRVMGVASFQITHFITSEDAYSNALLKAAYRFTQFIRRGHIHNILICGNAIATGEHGFAFCDNISLSQIPSLILGSMKKIAREEKKKGKAICAMLVKDFYPRSEVIAQGIRHAGFRNFQVDHNMVMPILPEWKTFDDYLQALITKFRTKAKSALNKSSALRIERMDSADVARNFQRMQVLYDNVYGRADFRLGKMNVSSLAEILKNLPDDFFVTGYWLNGELVGFCTAMKCGGVIEAHIIGVDYDHNKEHAIYQRMLYNYISQAIMHGCHGIVFGRTAAEIKSTIGAFPVDLTCCILHQRKISNALLKLILHYVKPSDYPQRQPYKAEVLEKMKPEKIYA